MSKKDQPAFTSGGPEYSSFKVAFGRTASTTKNRVETSPSQCISPSALDVPKKRRTHYPAQSYDMIRGEELLQKRYYGQQGIMESRIVDRSKHF